MPVCLSVDIFSVDNVGLQKMNRTSLKVKSGLGQRATDWWDCRPWGRRARCQAVCVALSFFCSQAESTAAVRLGELLACSLKIM
mgnify:CR=1 FL=1